MTAPEPAPIPNISADDLTEAEFAQFNALAMQRRLLAAELDAVLSKQRTLLAEAELRILRESVEREAEAIADAAAAPTSDEVEAN